MAGPVNAEELRKLEQEMQQAIQRQDFMEAIDICDEIEGKGWARAPHLVAKAQCLLRARRKQDAQKVLLDAFELDPSHQQAAQLLDEQFPGWSRPKPKPRPAQQAMTMGGPAPAGYGAPPQQAYQQPQQTYQQPQQNYAQPAHGYDQQSYAQQPAYGQSAPAPQYQGQSAPRMQAPQRPGAPGGFVADAPVNWNYVLEDLGALKASIKDAPKPVDRDVVALDSV